MSFIIYLFIISFLNYGDCQRRTLGGNNAEAGQLPHVVYIKAWFSENAVACTGCIIHEQWVLSAAHCVIDGEKLVKPEDVTIIAGFIDFGFLKRNRNISQITKAKDIISHPEYSNTTLPGTHDISLIQTKKRFDFNKYVNKLDFSTSPWPQNEQNVRNNCLAAGYGRIEGGKKSKKLKYFKTVAKHGRYACPCVFHASVLRNIVCLPSLLDLGVCYGDSGGALLCDGKIVGVAHKTINERDCASFRISDSGKDCGENVLYGAYTYTCPYLDWISEHVSGVPHTPASCKGAVSHELQKYMAIFIIFIFIAIV